MTNLPSTEDMKAWEKLIAQRLAALAESRGNAFASREALKCLRTLFALEDDPPKRAELYGILGLGEDIVAELDHPRTYEAIVRVHEMLSEFDRIGIEDGETVDAMHAVWHASLTNWMEFATAYCWLACETMRDHELDVRESLAPIVKSESAEVAQA